MKITIIGQNPKKRFRFPSVFCGFFFFWKLFTKLINFLNTTLMSGAFSFLRCPTPKCTSTDWRRTATRSPSTRKARRTAIPVPTGRERTCGPDPRTCWPGVRGTLRCGRVTRWTIRWSSPITSRIRATCWLWWRASGPFWRWWVPEPWPNGTCVRIRRRIRSARAIRTTATRTGRA